MNILVSMFILLCSQMLLGQDKSKQSLWPNGANAAAYSNITIDRGTVEDRTYSNLRISFGFQFLRLWDVASFSVGYGKVGFFDAVYDWSDDPGDLQFNYQGPTIGIDLAPNWMVSAQLVHYLNAKGRANLELESEGFDDRLKYEYEVSDTALYLGVQIWKQIKFILGAGQRTLKGSYKTVRNGEDSSAFTSDRPNPVNQSSSYVLIGIQGTQLMGW